MEQPNLGNLRSMTLERLVSDALCELERLGYSRRSRKSISSSLATPHRVLRPEQTRR